jgi:hypothetical protein
MALVFKISGKLAKGYEYDLEDLYSVCQWAGLKKDKYEEDVDWAWGYARGDDFPNSLKA